MGLRIVCAVIVLAACSVDELPHQGSEQHEVLDAVEPSELFDVNDDAELTDLESDTELVVGEEVEEPDDIYDPDRVVVYKITLDPDAEERLAAQPREYVRVELELVAGEASERMEVGLRLKGEASFRELDGKAAFRIKIDEYNRGQRLRGRRALTLNNMLQDRSLMAERLAYYVFRTLGAPAPRANHARLFVNGVYFGLYANIETPNEEFLASWFEDPHRNLYEETGLDFDHPEAVSSFELETNERQSDEREQLTALADACVAGDLQRARELVDWPQFLLYSALEASVNQVDGYSYAQSGANNYRIYDAAAGFVFIPWGLDWAFGPVATQDGGLFVDPLWVRPEHGVLMRMCLADDECTREYLVVVEHVASRWDGLKLEERMDRWAEQTEDALQSDDRREVSVESALADRETTREYIRGRADALREALVPR